MRSSWPVTGRMLESVKRAGTGGSLSEEQGVSLSTTLQLLLLLLLLQLAHSLVRRQMELQKHSRVPHIHVVAVFLLRRTRFLLRAANSAVGDVEAADQKSARSTALQESFKTLLYHIQLCYQRSDGVVVGGKIANLRLQRGTRCSAAPGSKDWLRPTFAPPTE